MSRLNVLFMVVVVAAVLLTPTNSGAYGAAHVGYTHVGPNGVYHAGGTVGYDQRGVAGYGRTTAYGSGGTARYGEAYRYTPRYSGTARYGTARYGYIR